MNTAKKSLMIVLASSLLLGGSVFAQNQRGPGKENHMQPLELTVEQREQIEDLRFDQQENMIDIRAKLEKQELELRKLERANSPNQKKIHAQIDKLGATRTEMAKLKADHRLAVHELLNEEQREQLKAMPRSGKGHGKMKQGGYHGNRRGRGGRF